MRFYIVEMFQIACNAMPAQNTILLDNLQLGSSVPRLSVSNTCLVKGLARRAETVPSSWLTLFRCVFAKKRFVCRCGFWLPACSLLWAPLCKLAGKATTTNEAFLLPTHFHKTSDVVHGDTAACLEKDIAGWSR